MPSARTEPLAEHGRRTGRPVDDEDADDPLPLRATLPGLLASLAALALLISAVPAVATTTLPSVGALALGAEASDVALADVDGDGDLDQVVTLPARRSVALLRNDGSGRFAALGGSLPDVPPPWPSRISTATAGPRS